jgi:hypothetical protein
VSDDRPARLSPPLAAPRDPIDGSDDAVTGGCIPTCFTRFALRVSAPARRLLLGVVAIESDFDPRAVSRVAGTKAWGFCGVMQSIAMSEAECRAQQPLDAGYRAGVRELRTWMRDHRVRTTRILLRAHGCGGWGIEHRCNRYDERVLAFAGRLR